MSGLLSLSGTKAANDLKVNVVNTSNINLHDTTRLKKPRKTLLPNLGKKSNTLKKFTPHTQMVKMKRTHTVVFPLMILLN